MRSLRAGSLLVVVVVAIFLSWVVAVLLSLKARLDRKREVVSM